MTLDADDAALVDDAHLARHQALVARHGKPETTDRAAALRLLGKRSEIHPYDVVAYIYASRESAEGFAASNLEHHGYPSLGITETAQGWLGIIDLRPGSVRVTDPAESDDWHFAPVKSG
jgi:hypothetical protein